MHVEKEIQNIPEKNHLNSCDYCNELSELHAISVPFFSFFVFLIFKVEFICLSVCVQSMMENKQIC